MPKFNTQFELNVRDIELIEGALQKRKRELSLERLAALTEAAEEAGTDLDELDRTLADIHTLLGRLHNQKVFYRPCPTSETAYVSG